MLADKPLLQHDSTTIADLGDDHLDTSDQDVSTPELLIQSFAELELSELLLTAINSMGWIQPTEVQKMCLGPAIQQQDVLGFAQTGTGKTGVFLIAIVHHILNRNIKQPPSSSTAGSSTFYPAVVVIAPTRELVMQIHEEYLKLTRQLSLHANLIIGGMDIEAQVAKLKLHHDVIMATPGRLKDLVQKNTISLNRVQIFVCDEVDRMFEIGFLSEVEYFLSCIDDRAQKLMFSATSNETLEELTFAHLNQPKVLTITPDAITSDRITQSAVLCSSYNKLKVFIGLLKDHDPQRALIFVNTKVHATWLHDMLQANGIRTSLITGDLPQRKRISLIRKIKAGHIRLLIATDVASRGLHIPAVTHVYNFDLPTIAANYIHRIGRTARAGAKGFSCSLVCDEYGSHLLAINEILGEPIPCEWFAQEYLDIQLRKPQDVLHAKSAKAGSIQGATSSAKQKKPSASRHHHTKQRTQQPKPRTMKTKQQNQPPQHQKSHRKSPDKPLTKTPTSPVSPVSPVSPKSSTPDPSQPPTKPKLFDRWKKWLRTKA